MSLDPQLSIKIINIRLLLSFLTYSLALDEKRTVEEHLSELKKALDRISQDCGEDAKIGVSQCIKICDIVKKKYADEKKQLTERIQRLEDQHKSHGTLLLLTQRGG